VSLIWPFALRDRLITFDLQAQRGSEGAVMSGQGLEVKPYSTAHTARGGIIRAAPSDCLTERGSAGSGSPMPIADGNLLRVRNRCVLQPGDP